MGVRLISPSATSIASFSPLAFLRRLDPVGVFLLVAEMQRVDHGIRHLHLGEDAAVEQRLEPFARADRHVMFAGGADVQVRRQFPVEQHRPAFRALRPKVLGHFAAREQRVDLRTDVVGDPVHAVPAAPLVSHRNKPGGREMQSAAIRIGGLKLSRPAPVPSASKRRNTMPQGPLVYRQALTTRITHWVWAVSACSS
jgi:hypothetical protein